MTVILVHTIVCNIKTFLQSHFSRVSSMNIQDLRILGLSTNRLEELTESIDFLTSLHTLNLMKNQLKAPLNLLNN